MLIRSTNKNEKIVLGLLSYTNNEDNSGEELRDLVDRYREQDNLEIYLFKPNETDNYIGLVAVEHSTGNEEDSEELVTQEIIYIHRIALIPSFRNEGFGYEMFCELAELYPNATIIGSLDIADLVTKWSHKLYNN